MVQPNILPQFVAALVLIASALAYPAGAPSFRKPWRRFCRWIVSLAPERRPRRRDRSMAMRGARGWQDG